MCRFHVNGRPIRQICHRFQNVPASCERSLSYLILRLPSEMDENIDIWLGNGAEKKLDTRQRRILITHWVGDAWELLQSDEYDRSRYRCFEKTGCLITADGSGDDKINPEGLPGYVVPPSLPFDGSDNAVDCPVPEAAPEPIDESRHEDEDEELLEETQDLEEMERVDLPKDRDYQNVLVKRKIRAPYNEWHTGTITWYNKINDKYRIQFKDGSEDYISLDDIDGVEVILQ